MAGPAMIGPGERPQRAKPLLRTMIGEVLRRTRLEQGRSLVDVSAAARVSRAYLSEVERGRKEASSEVLAAVCDALHIGLSDLLAGVARGLAADRTRGPAVVPGVVRLDSVRGRRASPQVRGPRDTVCLLAA